MPTPAYDETNIFAKILRGELPCHKVYEDDVALAFMDIMPRADGHVLVLPKSPARNILDADPAMLGQVHRPRAKNRGCRQVGARRGRDNDPAIQRARRRPDRVSSALPRPSALEGRAAAAAHRRAGKARGTRRILPKNRGGFEGGVNSQNVKLY